MGDLSCSLAAIRIENLRGFRNVRLDLRRAHTFLVGPNNSGKSSLLRILHWATSEVDDDLMAGRRQLSEDEIDLLMPAAETTGRARRVTLYINLPDGRRHVRFEADGGVAQVRIKVRQDGVAVRLGPPRRSEPEAADPRAVELMRALRTCERFVYVPNARDTASIRFRDAPIRSARVLIQEKLVHAAAGRPGPLSTSTKKSIDKLRANASEAVGPLAEALTMQATGMFESATMLVDIDASVVLDLLAEGIQLRLTTGSHDANTVPAHEVGSGLQSLLFVGLMAAADSIGEGGVTLLLEEPETFLHPAAQRELAQTLLDASQVRFVAATHSSAMLDEASAADVVLMREHRAFAPSGLDPVRSEIDSAFMSGQGAEALFARSVLLVEGLGDLAVFEQLRRRIARLSGMKGVASRLAVVQVGGCERFAPWIRLLGGYMDQTGSDGISWFALADGDAARRLRVGLREAKVTVPDGVSRAIDAVHESFDERDVRGHTESVRHLHREAKSAGVRAGVLPFDLEFSLLRHAKPDDVMIYSERFGEQATDGLELAHRLGSKFRKPARQDPPKADWMRSLVAEDVPFGNLDREVIHVLREWLSPALNGSALPDELAEQDVD